MSKLRDLRALGLAALVSSPSFAQQIQNPAPITQLRPDYAEDPFVIEEYHTRVRFENDGTGFRESRVRFGIRSAAGVQQLGQLAFGYKSRNASTSGMS